MKLFQIEEPEGPPHEGGGPGAVVGIAVGRNTAGAEEGAVAFSVGGNPEILPGSDGARVLAASDLAALLLGLRSRAEKQLARPVTHAVVSLPSIEEGPLASASATAGLTILDVLAIGTKSVEEAALEAALQAEDLAPQISPITPS